MMDANNEPLVDGFTSLVVLPTIIEPRWVPS